MMGMEIRSDIIKLGVSYLNVINTLSVNEEKYSILRKKMCW